MDAADLLRHILSFKSVDMDQRSAISKAPSKSLKQMATHGEKIPLYDTVEHKLSREKAIRYRDKLLKKMDAVALSAASVRVESPEMFNGLREQYHKWKKLCHFILSTTIVIYKMHKTKRSKVLSETCACSISFQILAIV